MPEEYIMIYDKIIVKVVMSEEGELRLVIDVPEDVVIVERRAVVTMNRNAKIRFAIKPAC